MILREISPSEKDLYDQFLAGNPSGHVIQSWTWGEFKRSQGTPPLRLGVFDEDKLAASAQLTLHRVPKTKFQVAYLPKGPVIPGSPEKILPIFTEAFRTLAKEKNLIFLKTEPKVEENEEWAQALKKSGFKKSAKWIFTEYNFLIDLTGSEEDILARMKKNGRYYIKSAHSKGVTTEVDHSEEALKKHLALQRQTAKRQNFLLHTDQYYQDLWQTLSQEKMAYLITAKYQGQVIATWIALHFGQTLYYTFGAYDTAYKELTPMHALVWAAIKLGRELECTTLDMWGAGDPELGAKQKIWGSHQFKENFGPKLIKYLGPYDLVFKPKFYGLFNILYQPALKVLSWLK